MNSKVEKFKLSIITVNFNNLAGLKNTMKSIVSQSGRKSFEWIVIDGGSTDGGKDFLEKNSHHIDYWVSEEDKGIYNAMNKGIKQAHGEYILFLNSGDVLFENNIIKNVSDHLLDKDIYVGNQKSVHGLFTPPTDPIGILMTLINMTLPHQASFIRKNLFDRFGLYNEKYKISSDWEFFIKSIILNNCIVEKLNFTISEVQPNGLTETDTETLILERHEILNKIERINQLAQYYKNTNEIIRVLTGNKCLFFLFRVYYYFYRKLNK